VLTWDPARASPHHQSLFWLMLGYPRFGIGWSGIPVTCSQVLQGSTKRQDSRFCTAKGRRRARHMDEPSAIPASPPLRLSASPPLRHSLRSLACPRSRQTPATFAPASGRGLATNQRGWAIVWARPKLSPCVFPHNASRISDAFTMLATSWASKTFDFMGYATKQSAGSANSDMTSMTSPSFATFFMGGWKRYMHSGPGNMRQIVVQPS
jgi:hypothetical protein